MAQGAFIEGMVEEALELAVALEDRPNPIKHRARLLERASRKELSKLWVSIKRSISWWRLYQRWKRLGMKLEERDEP